MPIPIGPTLPPGSCGLDSPAFCEEFEKSYPGGRAGDLDEKVWSFGRWGHETRQFFVRIPSTTMNDVVFPATMCGKAFSGLLPPDDVVICDGLGIDGKMSGQFNEVFHDQGDFGFNSVRIRQLFDFTDRKGTIVFDVDAKINPFNIGHGWWIELVITEDPSPMPYHEAPGVLSFPRNGVGFALQGFNACQGKSATHWPNALNRVFVTRNFEIVHEYGDRELEYEEYDKRCFKTADGKLNRFKFVISQNEVEVFVSDYDDPANLRFLARAKDLDLSFTRGYVHLQHAAYNARKDGDVTPVQNFRWDNVGFDGPTYALPRSYEVADNDEPDIDQTGGVMYGYYLNNSWTSLSLDDVDLDGATKASFGFTLLTNEHGRSLEYRFNGGETRTFDVPRFGPPGGVRGFAVDVPLADLKSGDNTLEVRMKAPVKDHEVIGNMDLSLEVPP